MSRNRYALHPEHTIQEGDSLHEGNCMKCRKNLRTLFAEYNSASAADKPNTALIKLKTAVLALKNPALHPRQLISRADVAADIANDIAMSMLGPGSTLISRYDDFV